MNQKIDKSKMSSPLRILASPGIPSPHKQKTQIWILAEFEGNLYVYTAHFLQADLF